MLVSELINDILSELSGQNFSENAVPENLPLIRTLQLVTTNDGEVLEVLQQHEAA